MTAADRRREKIAAARATALKARGFERKLKAARKAIDVEARLARGPRLKRGPIEAGEDNRDWPRAEGEAACRCAAAIVAAAFDLAPETMYRSTRGGALESEGRQIVAWLLRKPGRMSGNLIGELLGRDHSTIGHAVEKIETLIGQDEAYEAALFELGDLFTRLTAIAARLAPPIQARAP